MCLKYAIFAVTFLIRFPCNVLEEVMLSVEIKQQTQQTRTALAAFRCIHAKFDITSKD